jgi:23S rRNA pseudouridine2605 synthase
MPNPPTRHGLARVLSKLGVCSRSEATKLIAAGRVTINGVVRKNPEAPVDMARDVVLLNDHPLDRQAKVYIVLNKPRGLVTTASDEKERETVYQCFGGSKLPPLHAVGRLDMASEGMLLFTNDTAWSAGITAPESHLQKLYHVQIDRVADVSLLAAMTTGIRDSEGRLLRARRAEILRIGEKNSWLAITLDEGRNRHIRNLLQAQGCDVLRLVRVAIGDVPLGELGKGQWRHLTSTEVRALDASRR